MILDSISEISRYQHLHSGFSDVFRYILQNDLKSFSPGKSEIIDRKLFAITSEIPWKRAIKCSIGSASRIH